MKKSKSIQAITVVAILFSAVLLWAAAPQGADHGDHAGHDHSTHADHEGHDHDESTHHENHEGVDVHDTLLHQQLPAALVAVDKATTAVKFGDKKTALTELARLKTLILSIQKELDTHQSPAYANVSCPIMGNKIDPAKVTAALMRTYQGKKIAFCCAGCLPQWDKLPADQKAAKLKTVSAEEKSHDPDDGGDHSGHVH